MGDCDADISFGGENSIKKIHKQLTGMQNKFFEDEAPMVRSVEMINLIDLTDIKFFAMYDGGISRDSNRIHVFFPVVC